MYMYSFGHDEESILSRLLTESRVWCEAAISLMRKTLRSLRKNAANAVIRTARYIA